MWPKADLFSHAQGDLASLVLCSPALVASVSQFRHPSCKGCLDRVHPAPSALGSNNPEVHVLQSLLLELACRAIWRATSFFGFLLFPVLLPCSGQCFPRSPSKQMTCPQILLSIPWKRGSQTDAAVRSAALQVGGTRLSLADSSRGRVSTCSRLAVATVCCRQRMPR